MGVVLRKSIMINSPKIAWLIGLYTVDIEARITSLGYKLTRFYSHLREHQDEDAPSLIVFSNDNFHDVETMHIAKSFFPKSLLISLPVRIESVENAFDYPEHLAPGPSMSRLINSIKEREYRWDN